MNPNERWSGRRGICERCSRNRLAIRTTSAMTPVVKDEEPIVAARERLAASVDADNEDDTEA